MLTESDFHRLNMRTLVALVACLAAVIVCYVWIDRPVALSVHEHHVNQSNVWKDLTLLPPGVQNFAPLVLLLLVVRRAWGPWARWQKTLLVACVCMILAEQFRTSLASVCGRLWPDTWFGNPSLIGTGDYGFRPFEFEIGRQAGSFPSGHASRILGFATVWWLAAPRSRWLWIVVCPPLLVSLVAMNYHFVGDMVGGSFLGAIVAVYAVYLAELTPGLRDAVEPT